MSEKLFKGVDFEQLPLQELIDVNDFNSQEISILEALEVGQSVDFGGGAFGEQVVTRVA